jgi:putative ABC transport system permease protein
VPDDAPEHLSMIGRDRFGTLRRVFRLPLTRKRLADEVDAELQFHLEGRVDELVSLGMSRDAALIEARRRIGDLESHRRAMRAIDEETLRMRRRIDVGDRIYREVTDAVRALTRAPSFTGMTFLTLALALGAATAIFTILDAVVLRPLPYPHGDRLVALTSPVPGIKASPVWGLGRHEVAYFKQASHTLEDLGIYNNYSQTVSGDGSTHEAERVMTASASASLFSVLGIRPETGRILTIDDNQNPDLTKSLTVGLLSDGFWRRRFGADPTLVGRTIQLEGYPLTIVGVLPPDAQLPEIKVDVWLPLYINPTQAHNNHTYHAIGRLRPGVSVDDAQRELTRLTARFGEVFPNVYTPRMLQSTGFTTRVTSLRDDVVGELVTKALWILFGAVAVVLLIAAANVANLFLVRVESRRLEVTVRGALGANRADLAWHYLAESLVLTIGSSLGAIAVGWIGLNLLLALAPSDLPRLTEVRLGWTSVAFTLGCAIVAGTVLGVLPLAQVDVDLSLLREGGRGATGSRRRLSSRNALVVSQVALALVLLAAAGLLVRSLRNLKSVEPGFDATNVLTMSLALPNAQYRSYVRASNFYENVAAQLRSLPDVAAVGFGGALPLELGDWCTGAVIDVPGPSGERGDCVQMMQVTPGYFEALHIPLRGAAPTWAETNQHAAGAVVSAAFANRFWPNENAIGRGVRCCNAKPPFYRIMGVTGAVRTHGLDRPPGQVVYFPVIPFDSNPGIEGPATYMRLVVRTSDARSSAIVPAIRRIVHDADPQVPVTEIMPLDDLLAKSLARRSFTMTLLATAAALALILSAVGIYGVISYVVAQRRVEIGIRIALGAEAGLVRGMVVRQSLAVASVGIAIGLAAALATTRLLSALLFGVSPTDPAILAGATVVLLGLAVLASYAPARRASKVDPVEALRG